MMQIKNKLYLLPLCLISYLELFLLINIHPVMAMDPKLPETSSRQPVYHNLTIEENIINLKQKIYDNATKITNIDKGLQGSITDDQKENLLKLKENYKQLIDNQKEQLKTYKNLLNDLVMAMDPKLPETSSRQPVYHNLTIEENIINLKQKIYDNATKITNIDKGLQGSITDDQKENLLKLKENYKQLIDNQKEQLKTYKNLLNDLNDEKN
ncbi:MAG: SVM family protein [Sweet potato little leaf phytoplasma]|nr:SVM family protein [Sweet potato little leaf phytoplasma]MDV3186749.1 SVM family protein [Sweet potato little leaf phytoplasma]